MPFETENINFQSPLNFELQILRLPHISFNIQEIIMPGIEIGTAKMPTYLNKVHFAGDEVNYSPLEMQFIVQEGFRDWYEIWQWITDIAFPTSNEQYSKIRQGRQKSLDNKPLPTTSTSPTPYLQNLFSDIKMQILTSKTNPYLEVTFYNSFPLSLSSLIFKTTDEDVDYLTASVRFSYDWYDIKKI